MHLSSVDPVCKKVALRKKNIREMKTAMQELQALENLNPDRPENKSTAVNYYKYFLREISGTYVSIDPAKVGELQQQLTALKTDEAIKQLQSKFYEDIKDDKVSFDSISESYDLLKIEFVVQALEHFIASGLDPIKTRSWTVQIAAQFGHLEIVQLLLANGRISEEHRGLALHYAAASGRLDIVQALLANGAQISEQHRSLAVQSAAASDHLKIVKFFLANGAQISEAHRGLAVLWSSAMNGRLEVVEALLENGEISLDDRLKAVEYARAKGHEDIVRLLSENRTRSGRVIKKPARFGFAS